MCIFHQLCGVNSAEAKGLTWFTPGEDQSLISAAMLKAPLGKRMGNVEGCQVRVGELRLGLEVGPPKRQNQDESG